VGTWPLSACGPASSDLATPRQAPLDLPHQCTLFSALPVPSPIPFLGLLNQGAVNLGDTLQCRSIAIGLDADTLELITKSKHEVPIFFDDGVREDTVDTRSVNSPECPSREYIELCRVVHEPSESLWNQLVETDFRLLSLTITLMVVMQVRTKTTHKFRFRDRLHRRRDQEAKAYGKVTMVRRRNPRYANGDDGGANLLPVPGCQRRVDAMIRAWRME
jgi:hypothetical protein